MPELKELTVNFILVILFLALLTISVLFLKLLIPDFDKITIHEKFIVFCISLIELLFTIIAVGQVRNWFMKD